MSKEKEMIKNKELNIKKSSDSNQLINSSTHSPSSDVAIRVEQVSKKYCKSLKRSMLYGIKDIARNTLGQSSHSDNLRKQEFWAVDDVSFEVKKGETLGIIGPNGAGKTTLLKMLNGIFWPDKGKITINGRVGALIAVGAGFHPMLSGRENIYINGAVLGMGRREIDEKFDSIIEFADIGDFLDTPVKFYSSGMFVRLGFAIAVHCEPNILLVDEVLAVGDIEFQAKCFNRIGQLKKERNMTVILVSHNMHKISGFCDKVLYLFQSKTRYQGNVGKAIERYKNDISKKRFHSNKEFGLNDVKGSGAVRIKQIQFLDEHGNSVTEIDAYSILTLRIHYQSEGYRGKVELSFSIKDEKGDLFFATTNEDYKKELTIHKKFGYIDIFFKNLYANNQTLLFYFTLWKYKREELFDWKRELPLYVVGNPLFHGSVLLDIEWGIN